MCLRIAGFALAGLSLCCRVACGGAAPPLPPSVATGIFAPIQSGLDYHSYANVEQFRVTRVELDLRVGLYQQDPHRGCRAAH